MVPVEEIPSDVIHKLLLFILLLLLCDLVYSQASIFTDMSKSFVFLSVLANDGFSCCEYVHQKPTYAQTLKHAC